MPAVCRAAAPLRRKSFAAALYGPVLDEAFPAAKIVAGRGTDAGFMIES